MPLSMTAILRSSVLSTFTHSKILLSQPSSVSEGGIPCFIFRGPITPTLYRFFMPTCTWQQLTLPYERPCMANPSLSHSDLSSVYSVCLNLMISIILSDLVVFLSLFSFFESWRMSSSSLMLLKGFRQLTFFQIRVPRPNTIAMCTVLWFSFLPMVHMTSLQSYQLRRFSLRRMRFEQQSKMHVNTHF